LGLNKLFETAGEDFESIMGIMGRFCIFMADALRRVFIRPFYLKETVEQAYYIGVKSLVLTSVTALAVGVVMAFQTIGVLSRFGAQNYVAVVVSLAVVRELGPVLTAIMVAGRAGSGITAEIGSMKVTRQIDALKVSVVNPMSYLVLTRIMACTIVVPLLTIIADVLGIFGGMIGSAPSGLSFSLYMSVTLDYLGFVDVLPGLIKAAFFGFCVALIACFMGFHTSGGTAGVGRATTTTVVAASLTVMVSDVFLTRLLLIIFE
jgi:phospholipid/cholesterol/gamma-HCH transport system permease protein